jgi:hypothetical protein
MKFKSDSGKTIWDVIFSLDSSQFPVQRNYPQEPRGAMNPINGKINTEVCQKTVNLLRDSILDINDLYALDFELNYTFRKMADLILYADSEDINRYLDIDNDYSGLEDIPDALERILKKTIERNSNWPLYTDARDLLHYSAPLSDERRCKDRKDFLFDVNVHNQIFKDFALLQQSVQYIIEHSDYDWKTKANAFLQATSTRCYGPADDETLIYLKAQGLKNKELEEESRYRWDQYKKEWGEVYFTESNPYDTKKNIYDRLRFIHWNKLADLRLFEPQLLEHLCLRNHHYKLDCQHLLSAPIISDYTKVFSLFRADLDVDPIRKQLPKLLKKFYLFLAGHHWHEYNYTVSDLHYLTDMLFSFSTSRFQHDIQFDDRENSFLHGTRKDIPVNFSSSTVEFTKNISLVTLIALEIHCLYYSRPQGHMKFFEKAKKWLLEQQTPYGYWYDGANNPEYTTVLVLDALRMIEDESGVSFPLKTKPIYDINKKHLDSDPLLIINIISKEFHIGDKKIKFIFKGGKNKTWDFVCEVAYTGIDKVPLSIGKHKGQYDTLRRMLKNELKITSIQASKLLKCFIESDGSSYRITPNVKITGMGDVWTQSGDKMLNEIDPRAIRKRF